MQKKGLKTAILLIFSGAVLSGQVRVVKTEDVLKLTSHPDTTYVVNFWATWCKPCVKEIPSFDSLQTKFKTEPVKVVLVSLDFSEDLEKRVLPFLEKKQVQSACLLLDESNPNDYINRFCQQWSGAIPFTLVKKAGKLFYAERSVVMAELEHMIDDVRKSR